MRGPALLANCARSLAICALCAVSNTARAGEAFTLVGTEATTRDMTVNLAVDALRGDVMFGGRSITPPGSFAGSDILLPLLNHDSGVLDVQHTFLKSAPFSARSLIHFQTLKDELAKHCWTKEQASKLRATLRLFVVPPYGPDKHHRLWGTSPSAYMPRDERAGLDAPPASMPIAVFRQEQSWTEGPGQNSFFTATYNDQPLDVKRVGVATAGAWHGARVEPVDVCLNRMPGLVATSTEGDEIELCYDDSSDFEPWVEWDVSAAVRHWLEHDFAPQVDHGFSLYQHPGVDAEDQVRVNPIYGLARSRVIVTFASSSAAADCPGADGEWGGPDGLDLVLANAKCMSPKPNDYQPGEPLTFPRLIEPRVRPEWAPQLVIETEGEGEACLLGTPTLPPLDARVGHPAHAALVLQNVSTASPASGTGTRGSMRPGQGLVLSMHGARVAGGDAFRLARDGCLGRELLAGKECRLEVELRSERKGVHRATLEVEYSAQNTKQTLLRRIPLVGTVSEDGDGVPDAIEDRARHGGDGNQDGVPDRKQDHVASFDNQKAEVLTLVAPEGAQIERATALQLSAGEELAAVEFPHGFFELRVEGIEQGARAKLRLHLPVAGGTDYYAFGPLEAGATSDWFKFAYDGERGASVEAEALTLVVTDGGHGDFDLESNGSLVLVGGVGRPGARPQGPLTDATVGVLCAVAGAAGAGTNGAGWLASVWLLAFVCVGLRRSVTRPVRGAILAALMLVSTGTLGAGCGSTSPGDMQPADAGGADADARDADMPAPESGTGKPADSGADARTDADASPEAGVPWDGGDAGKLDGGNDGGVPLDARTGADGGDGGMVVDCGVATDAGMLDGGKGPQVFEAPFVDTGYFMHAFLGAQTNQSYRWKSPAMEHQSYFVGAHHLPNGTRIERRAYFVYDLATVSQRITEASLLVYGWQEAMANNFSGAFNSPDPEETVELHSLDRFTPQQVLGAPFNQNAVHTLDVPIWTDLGDGTMLGARVYTAADETGVEPAPEAPAGTACGGDSPCGKWLEFRLNADGVEDLNAASGLWALGASLATSAADPTGGSKMEWLNAGVLVDLSSDKVALYPQYRTPAPRLRLTVSAAGAATAPRCQETTKHSTANR